MATFLKLSSIITKLSILFKRALLAFVFALSASSLLADGPPAGSDGFGGPGSSPSDYAYKICINYSMSILSPVMIMGEQTVVTVTIESCTYYDANDNAVGWSMRILEPIGLRWFGP